MVLKSHETEENYDNLTKTLIVNCQADGTYDKNIDDYKCTKVCPHPINPDPQMFEISHNETVDPNPEIYDTVTYMCKYDKKLVTKAAFEKGIETNLLDDLMSMCEISGWLNEMHAHLQEGALQVRAPCRQGCPTS